MSLEDLEDLMVNLHPTGRSGVGSWQDPLPASLSKFVKISTLLSRADIPRTWGPGQSTRYYR